MQRYQIGLIGLAVMGANLARNIASRGFSTLVYNRSPERTEKFVAEFGSEVLAGETGTMAEFVARLEVPRKIFVMVQAGSPVDAVIDEILPHLEKDDIVIDCGNTHYPDTVRREKRLAESGIRFVGCGVSGGEEGALHGPSLMPGGHPEAYAQIEPILASIAARDFDGGGCVAHIGPGGAGHFVKMVHNGIEYAVMQTMAEAYDILRADGLSAAEIADVFERYAKGDLGSYLFDISVLVLRTKDDLGDGYLVDSVLDRAGQKGTGKWTVVDALERGVALPSIAEAVFARNVSARRDLRKALSAEIGGGSDLKSPTRTGFPSLAPNKVEVAAASETPSGSAIRQSESAILEGELENTLRASVLAAYAQGYDLIAEASREEDWNIDLAEVSRIWQGGCIIRAKVLAFLRKAFLDVGTDGKTPHLFEIPEVRNVLVSASPDWRKIVGGATENGIPVPTISAGLSYFDSLANDSLPANFLQGLRDHFGAHTYERNDRTGTFHSHWGA